MATAFTRRLGAVLLAAVLLPIGPIAGADTPNACVASPDGGGKFRLDVNFSEFLNADYGTLRIFDGRVNLVTSYQTHDCGNKAPEDLSGINVLGTGGGNWFMLDEAGGSLGGVPMDIDLGEGFDWVGVQGTPAADTYYAGEYANGGPPRPVLTLGLALFLIALFGVEAVILLGLGGNDFLGYDGTPQRTVGGGTFQPFPLPLTINGGSGKDRIVGGDANDKLKGGPGNDKLKGGKGKDKLNGGKGTDRCNGGPGKDTEKGCE